MKIKLLSPGASFFALLCILIIQPLASRAQQILVKGKVTDAIGVVVKGASVTIKGTNIGTTSDG